MGLFGPTGGGGNNISPTSNSISQSFTQAGTYTIPSGFTITRISVSTGFVGSANANILFPASANNQDRIILTLGTINAFNIVNINGGNFNANGVTINNNNASAQVGGNSYIWEFSNGVWVNNTDLFFAKPDWNAALASFNEIKNKPTIPNSATLVQKSGDTMTGKLNLPASSTTAAPINIGSGTAPTSPISGDLWIDGTTLSARVGGTTRPLAFTNGVNNFTRGQAVNVTENTVPALRITQLGTGEALRVEDETSPDATAFVVSNNGRVGIGVTPDATVSLSLDSTGVKFGDETIQTTAPVAQVHSDWNATTGISQILNRPFIPILLGHGSFSYAAGGNTRFFAQIFDLGAVTTAVERNFRVPQNCTIRAAIFASYIGGTAAAGHAGGTLRLRNKTTNTTQDILTYNLNGVLSGELGTYTASGLSLTMVAGDNYIIEQESGTFTTAPTSVRQMLTLYY
jgi:hypothetical protein